MSLEARLDNLAQTVELLAGMQIKTEEKMQQLIESNQRVDRAMLQVATILQRHEERLDRLDSQQ